LCETAVQGHTSGCGGRAWVTTSGSIATALSYLAKFDVYCQGEEADANQDLQVYGHSEFVVNLIFRVEGAGGSARFSGNVYQAPNIGSQMCLYDWTTNSTILTVTGPSVPLVDAHIYRMTFHTKMSGFHDPDEIVNIFALENITVVISDQPVLCGRVDACQGESFPRTMGNRQRSRT
jgi:hypothetical protein